VPTDELHNLVRELSVAYLSQSPRVVYEKTVLLAGQIFAHLQDESGARRKRHLYLAAGYLHAMAGWMAGDLGEANAIAAHNRTAWLCAEMVNHDPLRAWVLSTMSKTALWQGRTRDAADIAARGTRFSPSGTAHIMLACQQADAWAEHGDASSARTALHEANRATETSGIDEIGGLLSCGMLRYDNYAAAVLLRSGDPAGAVRIATTALKTADAASHAAHGTIA
jgi:hypothetical protein